jgi:hypothetical protein
VRRFFKSADASCLAVFAIKVVGGADDQVCSGISSSR